MASIVFCALIKAPENQYPYPHPYAFPKLELAFRMLGGIQKEIFTNDCAVNEDLWDTFEERTKLTALNLVIRECC